MSKTLIVEDHWLPDWSKLAGDPLLESAERTPVQVAEDVAEHGLDPDLYIAVVPAQLGRAGLVNRNRRIYPAPRFAEQNIDLGRRAADEFVAAEAGHPKGLPTFNVAARILSIVVTDADGSPLCLEESAPGVWRLPEDAGIVDPSVLEASGMLAFMNNDAGRNLWVCYKAGHPLGTSSRSFGYEEAQTLDADSPFLAANMEHEGEVVTIITGQDLITYDIVTTPSAGTYITKTADEAVEPTVATVAEPEQKDAPMEDTKSPDLKAALIALIAESLPAPSEGQSADITESDIADRVSTIVAGAIEPLQARLTEAENKALVVATENADLQQKVAVMEAEAEARARVAAMGRALTEAMADVHPALADQVRAFVAQGVTLGHVTEAEKIAAEVKRTVTAFEAISEATAKPVENVDVSTPDEPAPGAVVESLDLFGEGWADSFAATIAATK